MNKHTEAFTCALAGVNIEIHPLSPTIKDFCRDYRTDAVADFRVSVSQEDIAAERKRAENTSLREQGRIVSYSEDYLETLAIYRKIAAELLDYDVLLFHGSAVAMDGYGYLFTASSGTGKSTHTRLWRELYGQRVWMVNDDKPLLRLTQEGVLVCGTPWDGKHHLSRNAMVPLRSICLVERDTRNHIQPMHMEEAMRVCLQQCYRPEEPEKMMKTMILLEKLMNCVRFYWLGCTMDPEAARVSYEGMREQK